MQVAWLYCVACCKSPCCSLCVATASSVIVAAFSNLPGKQPEKCGSARRAGRVGHGEVESGSGTLGELRLLRASMALGANMAKIPYTYYSTLYFGTTDGRWGWAGWGEEGLYEGVLHFWGRERGWESPVWRRLLHLRLYKLQIRTSIDSGLASIFEHVGFSFANGGTRRIFWTSLHWIGF